MTQELFRVRINVVGPSRRTRLRVNRIVDGRTVARVVALCLAQERIQFGEPGFAQELRLISKAERELAQGKWKTMKQVFRKKSKGRKR